MTGEARRGAADRRHRHAGLEEALRGFGEGAVAPGVPLLGPRQDQQVTAGGVEIVEQHVGE